jgi:hypothetical protein
MPRKAKTVGKKASLEHQQFSIYKIVFNIDSAIGSGSGIYSENEIKFLALLLY